jgi:hypothetical protein
VRSIALGCDRPPWHANQWYQAPAIAASVGRGLVSECSPGAARLPTPASTSKAPGPSCIAAPHATPIACHAHATHAVVRAVGPWTSWGAGSYWSKHAPRCNKCRLRPARCARLTCQRLGARHSDHQPSVLARAGGGTSCCAPPWNCLRSKGCSPAHPLRRAAQLPAFDSARPARCLLHGGTHGTGLPGGWLSCGQFTALNRLGTPRPAAPVKTA